MTVGSLFAGIGGFDLAAERVGWQVKWQVEIDDYCEKALARHWPHTGRYGDIRQSHTLEPVDLVCGGFPCQDISFAGSGDGLAGERSGLWREFRRIVGELRPRYVVVENVAALTQRGLGQVLGDLAGLGFDAEWSPLSSCAVGKPHPRQRLFIVAYTDGEHGRARLRDSIARAFRPLQTVHGFARARAGALARLADPSALYRDADGVPYRLERNRAIGNSVDPDVAEWIFRQIQACDAMTDRPR